MMALQTALTETLAKFSLYLRYALLQKPIYSRCRSVSVDDIHARSRMKENKITAVALCRPACEAITEVD